MADRRICPFCKSNPMKELEWFWVEDEYPKQQAVRCGACGATGPFKATKRQAIAAWNHRADALEADQ